jgi:ribosomal protein S18 acetylase RimI-like enzyme
MSCETQSGGTATNDLDVRFTPVEVQARNGQFLRVCEYSPDNFRGLVEMYKGFVPKGGARGLPPAGVRRIAHWLDQLQYTASSLLVLDAKRVVAHSILSPTTESGADLAIFVHQDFRCLGIGTKLAILAVSLAAQSGFTELYLSTQLSNEAALRVFDRAGFRITRVFGDECDLKLELSASTEASAA